MWSAYASQDTFHIIMEYCDGGNLLDFLKAQQPHAVSERWLATAVSVHCMLLLIATRLELSEDRLFIALWLLLHLPAFLLLPETLLSVSGQPPTPVMCVCVFARVSGCTADCRAPAAHSGGHACCGCDAP